MCEQCKSEAKVLKDVSKDIGIWLMENDYYDFENIIKTASQRAKTTEYYKPYLLHKKALKSIFKRQEKAFPGYTIAKKLIEWRPYTEKANFNIEDKVDLLIAEHAERVFSLRAIIGQSFIRTIFRIAKDGFNVGGAFQLRKLKSIMRESKSKKLMQVSAQIKTGFNLTNKDTLRYLESYSADRVSQLNDTSRTRLRDIIVSGYKDGKGPSGIASMIRDEFKSFSKYRAEGIALTELSIASGQAVLEGYTRREIRYKSWITRGSRPCPLCQANEADGVILMNKTFASGVNTHPQHPNCYSDDTEVYTNKGWKLFNELDGEKIYALNPETHEAEFVRYNKFIKYRYDGEMHRFKSRDVDLLVTPDHRMYVGKRRRNKKIKNGMEWRFVEAQDISGETYYMRGQEWNGEGNSVINVCGNKIDGVLFAKFMAWWISDGSVNKRSENCYEITIAQQDDAGNKKNRDEIAEIIELLGFKCHIGKISLGFNDVEFGKYLYKLGKSIHRYIPTEVKNLNRDGLNAFIEVYKKADGHTTKEKKFKGNVFTGSSSLFTSSKKIADDLCEILLKIGVGVSYYEKKVSGKMHKFRNGTYKINKDQWVINILKTTRLTSRSVDHIVEEYNGEVYDVELEKWHILLVRRNGRVIWSGNCLCSVVPEIKNFCGETSKAAYGDSCPGYTWYGGEMGEKTI